MLVGIDVAVAVAVFGGAVGVGLGFGFGFGFEAVGDRESDYVLGFIILLDRSLRLADAISVG